MAIAFEQSYRDSQSLFTDSRLDGRLVRFGRSVIDEHKEEQQQKNQRKASSRRTIMGTSVRILIDISI